MRTIAALLLLITPALTVNAQNVLAELEAEARRYTVELIVFRYAEDIGSGGEIFVGEPLPVDSFPDETENEPLVELPTKPLRLPDAGFVRLRRSDFTMDDIMGRLERLRAYEPIMHFGWTQATFPADMTGDIALSSLTSPPAGIDGTFKLYLSRFLHLVVDLRLDAETNAGIDALAPAGPVRYHIEEDRIFRSGELRYFDHPKFGVLAKVTRIDEDADQPGKLPGDPVQ